MSQTPPGWYPDAQGTIRWFDGTRWTEATQPAAPAAPAAPSPSDEPTIAPGAPPAPAPYAAPQQPAPQPVQQPSYGGYPGGGYGPPGYAGPPKKSRTTLFVVLGVVAVLVIGGAIGLVVALTGGDGDKSADPTTSTATVTVTGSGGSTSAAPPAGGSPEETVTAFFDAVKNADCDTAETLVTQEFLDTSGGCEVDSEAASVLDDLTVTVGTAQIDGDAATVPVTEDFGSSLGTVDGTVDLVLQAGTWLVDNLDTASSSTASDAPNDVPSPTIS